MSQQLLKQLGITRTKVTVKREVLDLVKRQTGPFIDLHLRYSYLGLDEAIRKIARDCYLQGVADGQKAQARAQKAKERRKGRD